MNQTRAMIGRWVRTLVVLLGVVLVLAPAGCAGSEPQRSPGPLRVVVTVPPLEGLVAPVLPPDAQVTVLIPPGRDPHGFEMTPSDVDTLGRADLIVEIGNGFEPGLDRLLEHLKGPTVVRFAAVAGVKPDPHAHTHEDADGHDHGDEGNLHLWLDPGQCVKLVEAVSQRVKGLPGGLGADAPDPEAQLEAVRSLDKELADRLAPFAGSGIVTQHAAFEPLAERYGLRVLAVLRTSEDGPVGPSALADAGSAIAKARAAGDRVGVFTEPQRDRALGQRLAEAAGTPLGTLDPLGSGDWFSTMRAIADELARVLGGDEPAP